jgi:membrane-bound metal-dependent hydrolase YbcI (DUF457 family)
MFLLGHIGISIGIISLITFWYLGRNRSGNPSGNSTKGIDFRFVIVAAILPDIVDKIVGLVIFKEEFSNGRLFTHSIIIVGILSIFLYWAVRFKTGQSRQSVFYILPTYLHLLLDRMWEEPHTMFWPLFGIDFPRIDVKISDYLSLLMSEPYILTGEILGSIILILLFIKTGLYNRNRLFEFLRIGRLNLGNET